MKNFTVIFLLVWSLLGHASEIFVAKEIITLSDHESKVNALVIEGDKIRAIGQLDKLAKSFPDARINNRFKSSVIVPGFINQHDHPLLAALMMDTDVIAIEEWTLPQQHFPAATSPQAYLTRLKSRLAAFNGDGIFMSWGYHRLWHGDIDRALLDELAPNVPVLIWQRSGHEFILNSLAMQQLGISAAAFDQVAAEAKAQMNLDKGHFWEMGALALLPKLLPVMANPQRYEPALNVIKDYWHRAGSTRVVEPGGLTFPWLMETQMKVLGQSDSLYRMDYILDAKIVAKQQGIDSMIEVADDLVKNWGSDFSRYYPKQVKMFSDGAIFSQLMQMQDGYLDGHKGEWLTPPDKFKAMFAKFWRAGYQIHIHQNGDLGLDFVLDVIEDNMRQFPREDHRTTIVHFGFSTKEQVDRIAGLNVIVSANPYYPVALGAKYSEHGIGPERSESMVRLNDLIEKGVSVSLHSDMPMAPGQPLFLMWCAVNRLDSDGRVIGPEQRITPLQALKAVTIDAAYSLQQEKQIGSIEVGKLANLTVLEENPLSVDPKLIKDIKVVATVHEGTVFTIP